MEPGVFEGFGKNRRVFIEDIGVIDCFMASDDLNICVEALLHKRVKNMTPITPTAPKLTQGPALSKVVPDSDTSSESSDNEQVISESSDSIIKEVCCSPSLGRNKRGKA